MRCHEARSRIGPYLDSELDTEMSLKIEQHLESCPDCKRVFEAEAHLESQIQTLLCQGSATRALWDKAEKQLELDVAPKRSFLVRHLAQFRPVQLLVAAAALVVLLAALWWWKENQPLDLAVVSAFHHREYLNHEISAEFRGTLPPEFSRKLQGKLEEKAFSYLPSKFPYQSQGARLCFLKGVPSAMIFGNCDQIPVSMLVFKQTDLSHFPTAQQKFETGEPIVCSRVGRYQFAARLVDEYVICLVGELSKSSMEELLKTIKAST